MSFLEYSKEFQGVGDVFLRDPSRYLPFAQLLEGLMNGPSELSTAEREAIAHAVSEYNGCDYCIGSHGEVLKGLGGLDSAGNSENNLGAMLIFVHKLTATPGDVGQDDVDALRAAGFSDQTIEDIVGVVSLFAFLNRLVDGLGIEGTSASIKQAGGMIAQHGYGPLVQMIAQKAQAA